MSLWTLAIGHDESSLEKEIENWKREKILYRNRVKFAYEQQFNLLVLLEQRGDAIFQVRARSVKTPRSRLSK